MEKIVQCVGQFINRLTSTLLARLYFIFFLSFFIQKPVALDEHFDRCTYSDNMARELVHSTSRGCYAECQQLAIPIPWAVFRQRSIRLSPG
jgi:hypothetical protein